MKMKMKTVTVFIIQNLATASSYRRPFPTLIESTADADASVDVST